MLRVAGSAFVAHVPVVLRTIGIIGGALMRPPVWHVRAAAHLSPSCAAGAVPNDGHNLRTVDAGGSLISLSCHMAQAS